MPEYNRRTLVRGAAWSIPVVALAAQAPAFASSTKALIISSLAGCKLSGQGANCQTYRLTVNFNVQAGDSWTIAFTDVEFDGVSVIGSAIPSPTVFQNVTSASPTPVVFTICSSNSGDKPDIVLEYQLTNEQTNTTSTDSKTFLKFDIAGNC